MGIWRNVRIEVEDPDTQALSQVCDSISGLKDVFVRQDRRERAVAEAEAASPTRPEDLTEEILRAAQSRFPGKEVTVCIYDLPNKRYGMTLDRNRTQKRHDK
jgi:hypothetical protein